MVMSNQSVPNEPSQTTTTQSGSEERTVQSTLKDLLSSGIAQQCTFSDKSEDNDISGVMYVDQNRMRGDFTTVVDDKTLISHMMVKDDTSYTWQEGEDTGYMMKYDPDQMMPQDGEETPTSPQGETVDPDKVVDYKCSPWIVDGSMFNPPSNVEFTDFSSMMQKQPPGQENSGEVMQNPCSACDNLTGDAKNQCLTALKCN